LDHSKLESSLCARAFGKTAQVRPGRTHPMDSLHRSIILVPI